MTSNSSKIRVSNLGMVYGDKPVFNDLSFDIGEREIVSIVGPSGCGKTTLLRCVVGLNTPTSGAVHIDGKRVTGTPPGVAMVFQHFGLFPWKTVAANVAYGLTVQGVSRKDSAARVQDLIELVGLEGSDKVYPYQLSGGMQQRAGLARALAIEPSVLVMDEPFASLDAQTRDVLQFEVLRIWESRPTAMMFVTHSIDESVLMGDRIVILSGRPSKIYDIVDVNIPRPRDRASMSSERFKVVYDYVWNAIMTENARREAESEPDVESAGLSR